MSLTDLTPLTPWLLLALLGAWHGLNPGMGWLFAVALGLQERRQAAVLRALAPIALGHAASVAAVIALVVIAGTVVPVDALRLAGGGVLIAFGVFKLLAPLSHPRWVGMRVGGRDLVAWSFLMASAHGAGLMLVPLVTRTTSAGASAAAHAGHTAHDPHAGHDHLKHAASLLPGAELLTVLVHTLAMFAVMGLIAIVVYRRVGLGVLRRGWLNVDRVWAVILVATGAATLAV